jgi:hypothetical protein
MGATTTTGGGITPVGFSYSSGSGSLAKSDLEVLAGLIRESIAERGRCADNYMDRLMSSAEIVAARPGLTRQWLYDHADECGAIRKNNSKRSPFWFRLCDVDAAIDGRQQTTTIAERTTPAYGLARGRPIRLRDGDAYTAKGSPRSFTIRPRGSD